MKNSPPFDPKDTPMPMNYFLKKYNLSRTTFWRYRRAGLPALGVGAKTFVRESDFVAFLERKQPDVPIDSQANEMEVPISKFEGRGDWTMTSDHTLEIEIPDAEGLLYTVDLRQQSSEDWLALLDEKNWFTYRMRADFEACVTVLKHHQPRHSAPRAPR